MALRVQTYRAGSPRKSGQGLRIGTVRFLPRGVPKKEYSKRNYFDVWLSNLAPSHELVKAYTGGKLTRKQFFAKYRREMNEPQARHVIDLLAAVARHTPIAVGCYCEDETSCHRAELIKLILLAGKS